MGSQYEEDEVNSLHEFMREEAEAREKEIACHNCGEDTQDYLTKHDEDFWLCDICEKEDDA